MSDTYPSAPSTQDQSSGTGGTAGAAAEQQASHVAEKTADAGGKVLGSAKEETGRVASEARSQARDLLDQTKNELVDQAGTQQKRVADGLHSLRDELTEMADSSPGGFAGDLVAQAASRAGSVADWLEQRDPGSLVDEVRRFAREKPGVFIVVAAGAGLLVGRLTRSVASAGSRSEPSATRDVAFDAPPAGYPDARVPGGSVPGEALP